MANAPGTGSSSNAQGDSSQSPTSQHGIGTETQETSPQQDPSPTPSPQPPLFTFNSNKKSRATWYRRALENQTYIQLVVEREGFPNGAIIADRINPHLLFKIAPALKQRLKGRRIFIPPAACLDEEVIESVVFGLSRYAEEGVAVPAPVEKKPVPAILVHCVLVFFEMATEAQDLKDKLWDLFETVELKPMDVLWIWDTFSGRVRSESYTAPFASEYVQMMAWQILNLDAKGILNEDIRRLIQMEQEPKHFTETMTARLKTHGLGKDPLVVNAAEETPAVPDEAETGTAIGPKKSSDSAREHSSTPIIAKPTAQETVPELKPREEVGPSNKRPSAREAQGFVSAGTIDVFEQSTSRPIAFGASGASTSHTKPATSRFNFTNAKKHIESDPELTKQSSAKSSRPFESFQKGSGFKASKHSFGGPGQPPLGVFAGVAAQSATPKSSVGFSFGGPGSTQSNMSSSNPPTTGLRMMPGSSANAFGTHPTQQSSEKPLNRSGGATPPNFVTQAPYG